MCACMYVCMCVYVYMCLCVFVCLYVCLCMFVCTCMCVYLQGEGEGEGVSPKCVLFILVANLFYRKIDRLYLIVIILPYQPFHHHIHCSLFNHHSSRMTVFKHLTLTSLCIDKYLGIYLSKSSHLSGSAQRDENSGLIYGMGVGKWEDLCLRFGPFIPQAMILLVSKRCCVVQCSVVQCSAVQCGVVWSSVVQCSVVWCCLVLCSAVQCSVVLCCVFQCSVVQCSVVHYIGFIFESFCSIGFKLVSIEES